ncbi:MAG TPA: DUF4340 domain-containing protein [Saprospiraceae bacterium]|nr:DUF4340 domain-containing protein [Saprospiraceae bacterium]
MKQRNTLIWLLIFICLGGLSWYFLNYKNSKTSIDTSDREFAVKDIDQVTKIFLAKKNGEPITLEKINRKWYVNKKYLAFNNTIENLLDVLQKVSLKSIPPRAAYPVIMNDIASIGLKVEIYTTSDKPFKTYYVGGVTEDESGVYFLMDNARQPYVMHLDKLNSNIRHRYDIKLEDWRDRSLVPMEKENLSGVSVDYPYEPSSSFLITKSGNGLKLAKGQTPNEFVQNMNQKILDSYFENLLIAQTEAFENTNPLRSQISTKIPWCRIAIKSTNLPDSLILSFYPINEEKEEPIDLSPEYLASKKFFRLFVNRSDGDFLLLQINQASAVLKTFQELRPIQ